MLQRKKWLIRGGLTGLLLLYGIYVAGGIYGIEMVPDELGYWSYSAFLSGMPWTEVMKTSTFFSYGYTLFLLPLRMLCKDPVIAARISAGLNVLLLAGDLVLLEKIAQCLYGKKETEEENQLLFYAAIAIFYPGWLFYAHFTLPETLLMSGYLALCLVLFLYLQEKKRRYLVLLLFLAAYLYMVHLRMIAVFVLLLPGLKAYVVDHTEEQKKKRGNLLLVLLFLLGAGLLLHHFRMRAEQTIFTGMLTDRELSENGYQALLQSIFQKLSIKGIATFILHLTGKLYYLGIASYGLFWFGLLYLLRKSRDQDETKANFARTFLLMAVAVILVAAGFTMLRESRPNGLLYGRYDELLLPVFMVSGMLELRERFSKGKLLKNVWETAGLIALAELVITLVLYAASQKESSNFLPGVIPGTSYTFHLGNSFLAGPYYRDAYMIGMAGMVIVLAVLYLAYQKKQTLLWFVLIAQILLAGVLFEQLSRGVQMDNYQNLQMTELIREEDPFHERCIYLKNPEDTGLYNLQFLLWDKPLLITSERSEITGDDLVITSFQYRDLEAMKEEYPYWYVLGHSALFIRTEALSQERVTANKIELAYKIADEMQRQTHRKNLAIGIIIGIWVMILGSCLKKRNAGTRKSI